MLVVGCWMFPQVHWIHAHFFWRFSIFSTKPWFDQRFLKQIGSFVGYESGYEDVCVKTQTESCLQEGAMAADGGCGLW